TRNRVSLSFNHEWRSVSRVGAPVLTGKFKSCLKLSIGFKNFTFAARPLQRDLVKLANKYVSAGKAEWIAKWIVRALKAGEPREIHCDTLLSLRTSLDTPADGYIVGFDIGGEGGIPFGPSVFLTVGQSERQVIAFNGHFELHCPYDIQPSGAFYGPGGGFDACELLPPD
ncbi:MAG TPA: hypothetical protein VEV82_07640, partial [Actinomycetota bacterium]|nr:hypothetical protein [Actinomycetota bacterium]